MISAAQRTIAPFRPMGYSRVGGARMKPDLLTQLMGFLYSIARYLGLGMVAIIKYMLPSVPNLDVIAEPLGFMTLITLFVILTSTVRKVAIIILIAGWSLLFLRLILMIFRLG
jgi:hypothetical protein